MKKTMIALATAGLVSFGTAAQAGDVAAGQAAYASCAGCHGGAAEGGVGPKLAGAKAEVTIDQLKKYRAGEQIGPMSAMMIPNASSLTDADIDNIAAYIATL